MIDLSDMAALVGIALIGAGCWLISPAAGLVAPGVLLVAAAIIRMWSRARAAE